MYDTKVYTINLTNNENELKMAKSVVEYLFRVRTRKY